MNLSIAELYSDNVYLTYENEQNDFLTKIMPDLLLEAALTEKAHIDLTYTGIFDHHHNVDNFRVDHHFANADFKIASSKGSSFLLGVGGEDSARDPYSKDDRSKDYWLTKIYSEVNWKMSEINLLGVRYEHIQRRFDEEQYQEDDYKKDNFHLHLFYTQNPNLSWLVEYNFEQQKNDHLAPYPSEFIYQEALAGFQFRPEHRLSGKLGLGYFWSELNDQDAFDGWTMDIDLKYRLGAFIDINFSAERGVHVSEKVARDSLDYYISSEIGISFEYRYFAPLMLFCEGVYTNREYRLANSDTIGREDDLYRISVRSTYKLKEWLSFSLGYSYRDNRSDRFIQEYKENSIIAEVVLSI